MPMLTLLGWRFLIASLIISGVFYKKMLPIRWEDVRAGLITGIFLFGGFYFFASGLRYTEASRSGFIVGLFVIMVPLMTAIIERRRPDKKALSGGCLAVVGLGVMSLSSIDFALGDLLIFISAFFFGAQLVATGIYAKGKSAIRLVLYQLLPCGLLFLTLASWMEPPLDKFPPAGIFAVMYLAVMASAVALILQTWAQKHTPADHAAVIYASEPVFGVVFSVLALGEVVGMRTILGGALILMGMLWVELGPGRTISAEEGIDSLES
jgi:drug/metabolite transporter (DMT)-like permease